MHEDYLGCEILFPDTVFYTAGKPKKIVKTDPVNFCLESDSQLGSLVQSEIYENIQSTVMQRFRDEKGLFQKKFPDFKMSMKSKALHGVSDI